MAKKSNGEGSIITTTLNGKPYYKGSVTVGYDSNGKQIKKSFGSYKKSIVLNKMDKAKYEAKNNMSSNSNITFGNLFKDWIFNFKKMDVSDNTFSVYETTYRLRLKDFNIANKRANQITLNDLQVYFNELQEKFTAGQIKRTYIHIHSCIKFAIFQGIMVRDYCGGIILQKEKKKEKYNVFSKQEQNLILDSLNKKDIIDCLIYFTFYTGLRLGEVLALKWSDIKDNMLSVERQYGKRVHVVDVGKNILTYEFKDLKTKNSKREIPLPSKLLDLLKTLPKDYDLIFTLDGKPFNRKKPQRRMISLCKTLKIEYRSFHSIRHSYATRLFELDIPIKTVQSLMGHSNMSTTMDIYTHVMKDKKLEILDKLDNL